VHAFRFTRETDGSVLTFDPRAVIEGEVPATGEALRSLFAAPRTIALDGADAATGRIATLMADLADEFAAVDAAGSPVPLWLARALIWRLARLGAAPAPGGGGAQALYTRFIVLVEAHHRAHWPVARYAERLGLTSERLNRLTRAETGKAALELIHDRLTREACRQLTYVAAPIAKLAFELGFEDPAYFCRFFKRRVGRSPRDYRRATVAMGT
jgi:AraC family transcriptional regulator, transcriptional activator of pobA